MGEGDLAERCDNVDQEIGGHEDIGVADDEQVVLGQAFQFQQLGNLRIRAGRRGAHDELRVVAWELLQEPADDPTNRVVGCGYAEEDLRGAGVLLHEPASQAVFGGRIAPFEGLEQRQGRLRVEG
jgi:hypothetical protein